MNFSELIKKFKSGEASDFFSNILIAEEFGPHITCCIKKGNNIFKIKNASHNNSVVNLFNIELYGDLVSFKDTISCIVLDKESSSLLRDQTKSILNNTLGSDHDYVFKSSINGSLAPYGMKFSVSCDLPHHITLKVGKSRYNVDINNKNQRHKIMLGDFILNIKDGIGFVEVVDIIPEKENREKLTLKITFNDDTK